MSRLRALGELFMLALVATAVLASLIRHAAGCAPIFSARPILR